MRPAEDLRAKINRLRFDSHRWATGLASGPSEAPDWVTYCADCGCEHTGDPTEFPDLVYPDCKNPADDDWPRWHGLREEGA